MRFIFLLLLLISSSTYAQEPNQVYFFNEKGEEKLITQVNINILDENQHEIEVDSMSTKLHLTSYRVVEASPSLVSYHIRKNQYGIETIIMSDAVTYVFYKDKQKKRD